MAPLADELLSHPLALALITLVVVAVVAWQSRLGPDDDWIWSFRRRWWPRLDPSLRRIGRPTVREKGVDEYVYSTEATLDEIDQELQESGYDANGLSTLKYVVIDGKEVVEWRSYAFREHLRASEQTHAYVFDWGNKRHFHQHIEPNVTFPRKHHESEQVPGDPDARLHAAIISLDPHLDVGWVNALDS